MNIKLTNNQFITEAQKIHGLNTYQYHKVNYINNKTKVCIVCPKHFDFLQTPANHIYNSRGCPKCKIDKIRKLFKCNINDLITKFQNIHKLVYDYSLISDDVYINNKSKVPIICHLHGVFYQKISDHLSECGCPKCNRSKGELLIEEFLKSQNEQYEYQKRFKNCKNIDTGYQLVFDFYLPNRNICIEYDGEQHFQPIKFQKMTQQQSVNKFQQTQKRDQIKDKYCKNNKIKLIRIPYQMKKEISNILSNVLT